jgi:hypothetical protein
MLYALVRAVGSSSWPSRGFLLQLHLLQSGNEQRTSELLLKEPTRSEQDINDKGAQPQKGAE